MFNSIGNKISLIRKELGMTQQEMAEKIGISRSALVKIENSQRAISLEEGKAISKVLGISLDTLLAEEEESASRSFVKAFKSKGMTQSNIGEIAKYELLFDAFITQEQIYRGE